MLENTQIYWISKAKIPKLILDLIRNRIFDFLWFDQKEKGSSHLVKWERIASLMEYGGWGLKNILHFGTNLASKSLWRALFKPGLWSEVIKSKYIKQSSVTNWIRKYKKITKGISNVWNYLIHSLPAIFDWLAWKPRNGEHIRVGEDPMIGATSFTKLFDNLVKFLHDKGVVYLAHIGRLKVILMCFKNGNIH